MAFSCRQQRSSQSVLHFIFVDIVLSIHPLPCSRLILVTGRVLVNTGDQEIVIHLVQWIVVISFFQCAAMTSFLQRDSMISPWQVHTVDPSLASQPPKILRRRRMDLLPELMPMSRTVFGPCTRSKRNMWCFSTTVNKSVSSLHLTC